MSRPPISPQKENTDNPALTFSPNLTESISGEPILAINKFRLALEVGEEKLFPVDGIDLVVDRGENLCIVGESGSGKSLTALSIMRLIDLETKAAFEGEIVFEGKNILGLDQKSMSAIRGSRIALIPQEPMTALNPVIKIGKQLEQVGLYHRESNKKKPDKYCR